MYVVGVDGGTTKTIAFVANEQGQICGRARGGGSNWAGEDVEIPMAVVIETVKKALDSAGITGKQVESGVFTLAGADWPEDHTRRESVLRASGIAKRVKVKNDAFGGLRAGLSRPYGMVLAVGTGMNAAVITPDGREWAEGYYETFGGAGTLAQDAFYAVLRAEDGRGKPTLLTEKITRYLGFDSVEAMLRAYILEKIDRADLLRVCPFVFEAALACDPVAVEILIRQGKGLAEYVAAMTRRFQMQELEFELVLAGSVFKGAGPLLVDTITQEVHTAAPYAKIVRPSFEPVMGSVMLAYDDVGLEVSEEIRTQMRLTAPDEIFFNTSSRA